VETRQLSVSVTSLFVFSHLAVRGRGDGVRFLVGIVAGKNACSAGRWEGRGVRDRGVGVENVEARRGRLRLMLQGRFGILEFAFWNGDGSGRPGLRLMSHGGAARRLALGEVLGGTEGAAEPTSARFTPDVDASVRRADEAVAVEAGGAVGAAGAGAADARIDEGLGELADAELALGLLGEGELGPGLGIGEGGEKSQD
jgi:hypothetical protein